MKKLFYIFCVIAIAVACKKDQVPPITCTDNVSYSADILPLINLNCSTSACHSATDVAGGYDFTTYASISSNVNKILSSIDGSGPISMPQGQPSLADSIVAKVACWSANGALEN